MNQPSTLRGPASSRPLDGRLLVSNPPAWPLPDDGQPGGYKLYRGPLSDQSVVWRQMARISGISFQAIAAVGLGVLVGILFDRAVPAAGYAGAIVGGVLGSILSIYLMVRGMRRFFAEADAENARAGAGKG